LRFYTKEECEKWLKDRGRHFPDRTGAAVQRVGYPTKPHMVFVIARWIASNLSYRQPVLLWISEWGIWPSSENWQLYYRVRESYGDNRLLNEAPGHLFLECESEDLASMIEIAMLNGWGGYILTEASYASVFFSHDEYVDFLGMNEGQTEELRKLLA
jgi:hypothetical protein